MRPGIGWNAPCSVGDFAFIRCSNFTCERLFVIVAAIHYLSRTSLLDRTQNWRPGTLCVFCFDQKFFIHCNAWSNLKQEIQFLKFMGGWNYSCFIWINMVFQCQYLCVDAWCMYCSTQLDMECIPLYFCYSLCLTNILVSKNNDHFHEMIHTFVLINAWLLAVCIHKYKDS